VDTEGVYVGRLSPMHIGHEAIIHTMLEEHGRKNCVVMIGSCNAAFSLRDMFSYAQRQRFVKTVFPELSVVGLPDYGSDQMWLLHMDDMLRFAGINPQTAIYYGGSITEYHMQMFLRDGRTCSTIDRTLDGISATKVRDGIIMEDWDSVSHMVNPRLRDLIIKEGQCIMSREKYLL